MSGRAIDEEEEVSVTHTGPKGVINDWRKFKLESVDQESLPPNKRELLRQMSSPQKPKDDSLGSLNRKSSIQIEQWNSRARSRLVQSRPRIPELRQEYPLDREQIHHRMSVQEYELLKEDDERCLRKYRKQCMQEMHERLSFGPKFEVVYDLENGEAFLEVIEKEHKLTTVVVHIYKESVKGCDALNSCLDCLAAEYPTVKFCRIKAAVTGAGEQFSDDVLPAVLVYKAGEMLGNFLAITQHFNEEFFATDVEAFLNDYGLLPEKELRKGEEEADVE